MKRLLISLLCFFVFAFASSARIIEVTPVDARMSAMVLAGNSSTAASGNACDSTADADIWCEDMEGSSDCGTEAANDQNCRVGGYSAEESSAGIITYDASHSDTFGCTDAGSYAHKSNKPDTTNEDVYIQYTITNTDPMYAIFYFNLTSFDTDAGEVYFLAFRNSDLTQLLYMSLYYIASEYRLYVHDPTGNNYTTINKNTWYKLKMKYQASTGSSDGVAYTAISTVGGEDTVITNVTNHNQTKDIDNFRLGAATGNTTRDSIVYEWDNFKIDNDAYPAECAE